MNYDKVGNLNLKQTFWCNWGWALRTWFAIWLLISAINILNSIRNEQLKIFGLIGVLLSMFKIKIFSSPQLVFHTAQKGKKVNLI